MRKPRLGGQCRVEWTSYTWRVVTWPAAFLPDLQWEGCAQRWALECKWKTPERMKESNLIWETSLACRGGSSGVWCIRDPAVPKSRHGQVKEPCKKIFEQNCKLSMKLSIPGLNFSIPGIPGSALKFFNSRIDFFNPKIEEKNQS